MAPEAGCEAFVRCAHMRLGTILSKHTLMVCFEEISKIFSSMWCAMEQSLHYEYALLSLASKKLTGQ